MPINEEEFRLRTLHKLDQIILLLKMANIASAQEYFSNILDTEQKKLAYQMSDGENTIENIMIATGIRSSNTISNWWAEWLAKGIVLESESRAGRKQKIFDLLELGFSLENQ